MRRTNRPVLVATGIMLASISFSMGDEVSKPLDVRLLLEDTSKIARESGDPIRGALVFFRPSLQCARCHTTDAKDKTPPLGPDLAAIGRVKADRDVVESILEPSKGIRKGFETVAIATRDGKSITGLIASERPDAIVVRDPAHDGDGVTIPRAEIDEMRTSPTSLMPAGLVNQLADRREFLDLVRYVLEISEGGAARALALRPPESAFAVPPLPEYERNVDHAGIIASLDVPCFERGKSIYERICANCHGTIDRPGSLPNSLRFASGVFKNGSDPFRIYQTLTHGFGQMAPQSWMVPEQKYHVIPVLSG